MIHDLPTPAMQEKLFPLTWNKLAGITTNTATPSDEAMDNVRLNINRPYPWFHNNPTLNKPKTGKIALIGGGPSIKDTINDIVDYDNTIVCGSAHDWTQKHLIKPPDYCAVCDPDPVMANYLRHPNKDTKYLISSHCNDTVFEALKGYDVIMWHCWPIGNADQAVADYLQEHTPGWVAIGGGCTVGLRSLTIALMLGYSDIHFFGFDSCMGMTDDNHHAYAFTDTTKEFLGQIYDLKIGIGNNNPTEKQYRVAGYQLAQADHYKQMLAAFGHLFKPTFHGSGLLPDLQSMIDNRAAELLLEGEAA